MKKLISIILCCICLFSATALADTLTVDGLRLVLPEGCSVRGIGQGNLNNDGSANLMTVMRSAPIFQVGVNRCEGQMYLQGLKQSLLERSENNVDVYHINGLDMLVLSYPLTGENAGLVKYEIVVNEPDNTYLLILMVTEIDHLEDADTLINNFAIVS